METKKRMQLRTRIIIAFVAMVTIPVIAMVCILYFFQYHKYEDILEITEAAKMAPAVQNWLINVMVLLILILIMASFIMAVWIYTGVVAPLKQLQEATRKIRDGQLDFTIEAEGSQEIAALCEDFESMRKQLQASAEEKEGYARDNRELIRNISHDLKTPITAVKGYVEGIMDGVADTPEKVDRYMRTIHNKTLEMDRLINELTFYAKIDTNRIPYNFSRIDITDYFVDCVEEISLDLNSQGIDLTYLNELTEPVSVIADAEQLKRVINNIISNSVKYMDKPYGRIEIRLKDVGDFVQVEIEDNGKGIGQKDLPRIFDRFYRTDTSRNSGTGGNGIGLSIVRKIMEDHGGKVWASSKEGVGTVMYLVLRKYTEVMADE